MEGSQDPSPGPASPVKSPAEDSIQPVVKDPSTQLARDEVQQDNSIHAASGGNSPAETLTDQSSQAPLQPKNAPQTDGARDAEKEPVNEDNLKRELMQDDCESELGYAFPTWKKWWILTVIFFVQTSMNFNTSLYSNGIPGIAGEFHVSEQTARCGAALFLITYAFGCELWAPWSEEFGRRHILQLSLTLTNIWAIPIGWAPSIATVLVCRALGGLSTAGGSVTLGMVADLYDSDNQQYAVAFVVFSSVFGSILGPIIGGFVELLPPTMAWRWCTWIQLIFGAAVQLLHFFTVPETRTTILVDRVAKKRREAGLDDNVYGPGELHPFRARFTFKELMETWSRAFKMLLKEPIVRWLSLLSGVSDAIVFIQIQSMNLVYKQWDFNSWQIGLAFIPIAIGYAIAWVAFFPAFKRNRRRRDENPRDEHAQFESRLYPLLWAAPCLPIGLLIFAWTSSGPPLHWIGTMFGTALIGIANYSIYMATIDYMICAYGPYSASATGGNGLARDLLAGLFTFPAIPFYENIGAEVGLNLEFASTILAVVSAVLVVGAVYVYWKGPSFRRNSPFAQNLASREGEFHGRHISLPPRPPSIIAAEAAEAAEVARVAQGSPDAQDAHEAHEAGEVQEPAAANPMSTPRGRNSDVERGWAEGLSAFGPSSPQGSYMASVHAASRRQSRQASRNASANASRRNSHQEGANSPPGSSSGPPIAERLAERLENLNTIDSVLDEPDD
ncbi:major facilitator superfamily domain-containing protein [Nemania abortiva]|nr:major facilitator superfamily domain-containing protein [Nemania abortiva]